jgi:pyruvate kinase
VPRVQKEITRTARRRAIPVIVATQVLESMRVEARPTRAEVNDAANAVDDGVDAIMLSGETATGVNPPRTVQTLDAIIRDAEASPAVDMAKIAPEGIPNDHGHALCDAAVTLARQGNAAAIVAVTRGGRTARRLSALRPRAPIIAATDSEAVARRLALYWGVVPLCTQIGDNVDAVRGIVGEQVVGSRMVAPGSAVVLISLDADLSRGGANYLKIHRF